MLTDSALSLTMMTTGTYHLDLYRKQDCLVFWYFTGLIRPLKMFHKKRSQLKLGIVDEAENGDLSSKRASYLYYQSYA